MSLDSFLTFGMVARIYHESQGVKRRSHTFKNACFETKFGGLR